MAEIERLIVFNDELMDPQPVDPRFQAWTLVSNAYRELRESTSARFRIRSSSPGCSEEFGWADYQVGNLTGLHPYFSWIRIDDGDNHFYVLQQHSGEFEHWRQAQSGWAEVGRSIFSDAVPGWRGKLADPHHMLESILYFADWTDAEVSIDSTGRAMVRVELDRVRGNTRSPIDSVEIVLAIDDETYEILEYSMDWSLSGETCDTYQVEARDGQHSIDFTFPKAVLIGSDYLIESCDADLGSLKGYARRLGNWARECGIDPTSGGYYRSYRFSLDDWAFVRFELSSADDVSFNLLKGGDSGELTMDLSVGRYLVGGYGVPDDGRLRWAHTPLSAGDYTVEVITHNRALPSDFTFVVNAQPPPPPPYRFKSVSVGAWRTCGLLLDGTPLCWGRNNVDGEGSEAPDGRFASISTGGHTCAIREDGTPVCWDFKYDQTPPVDEKLTSISTGWIHSCGLHEDGTPVCWGSNQEGKAAPPPGERFMAIDAGIDHSCGLREDGAAICWGRDWRSLLSAPVGDRFVAISVGEQHSCGLREDGSTMCWGHSGLRGCVRSFEHELY